MPLTIPNTFVNGTPAVATEVNSNFSAVKTLLDTVESNTDGKVSKALTLNAQTGVSYTLLLVDDSKVVTLSNASAITLTVPPNSSVAFPIGSQVNLVQTGAGQVTVAAGAGVTLRSQGSKFKLNGIYSAATLLKIAADEWVLVGNTAA
ncbi:hypothetical protein UFOVP355_10 [uncultured Caudovirales phage]|uniref:Uncharacterized protein n=1 Tax=uncultured Caudovirales phage TaxID=2100421 RepID=A0A6J5NI37_9CAUD|nr:hypothetical protein UFOVP355_10 [uncultured Caudovirales phage]CAB4156865.1 hypothetical protein UFOVP677_10 [uncultured Caudovirales phage]